jgi:tetratricopeptide (TPR) repeat protein
LKNVFAIVTLTALLSSGAAAAQGAAAPAPAAVEPAPAGAAEPATAASAASATDPSLPNVELTGDLLYKLTRAELEFKLGQWQGAYVTLMSVAQQTRDPRIAQRAAEMALAVKQGGEALAAIRLWRTLAPDSQQANQYFLAFAVLGDSLDEAEQVFARNLREAAPAARALLMFQMQQVLSRAKDKAAAFALLERVLVPYLDTQEAHLVLAQGAFANGDGARAVREATQALALKPDSELAILTLAQVRSDAAAAIDLLAAFLEKHPDAREVRAAYARILIEQKQYAPARQQFLTLLKAEPDNLPTLYALGVLSMQIEDAPAAESYFKQFLAVQEKRPIEERDVSKVLLILSQIAEERRDIGAALAWLEKIEPSDEPAFFNAGIRRAQLLAQRGDVDGGRTLLATMQTEDAGEQVRILLTDAQLLRDAGHGDSAYTVLENGVKRFPDSVDLLYDFALAAEKMKRLDVMEASLRRVIAQAPDNHHAYNALGYAFAEHNMRLPEAHALIAKALVLAPGDPFIMDSMGWVEFRMGNLEQAEQLLRRAHALRSDPEIALHLGEVLWQRGDRDDAMKLWREVQAKDPGSAALKDMLARLNLSL